MAAASLIGTGRLLAAEDKPAALGGTPICDRHWPSWPVTEAADEQAVMEVLRSGQWFRYANPQSRVTAFEERWAETTGSRFCQTTTSGTTSLITALAALDIGPGDEVLVPPYTFIATVNAVLLHHALPVFVDSDPDTAQIDVSDIEGRITEATRCIMPVHLGGGCCDMDRLLEIARRRGLAVVEDSCQTHTGQWHQRRLGTLGDAGCFSFQNSKNLTGGEGGAILTNDEQLYYRAQAYQNQGSGRAAYEGRLTANGGNFRLTEFQGALLLEQLSRLDQQSRLRESNAAVLDELLEQIPGLRAKVKPEGLTRHGYHLYLFDYDPDAFAGMSKGRFQAALQAEGVPVSGGYGATNRMAWVDQVASSRGFLRIYGPQRMQQWREQTLALPQNDAMLTNTCWLTQSVLLTDPNRMQQIAEAIGRVQRHAGDILRG